MRIRMKIIRKCWQALLFAFVCLRNLYVLTVEMGQGSQDVELSITRSEDVGDMSTAKAGKDVKDMETQGKEQQLKVRPDVSNLGTT